MQSSPRYFVGREGVLIKANVISNLTGDPGYMVIAGESTEKERFVTHKT